MIALIGAAVIAALLPRPTEVLVAIDESADGFAATGDAVLASATIVVWAVIAWIASIVVIAIFGRLPGFGGLVARRLLCVLAPRALRRVLLVAAGVSIVAGASACGTDVAPSTSSEPAAVTTIAEPAAYSLPSTVAEPGRHSDTTPETFPSDASGAATGTTDLGQPPADEELVASADIDLPLTPSMSGDGVIVLDLDWPSTSESAAPTMPSPAEASPAEVAPVEVAPVEDTPVEDTPVEVAPVEDTRPPASVPEEQQSAPPSAAVESDTQQNPAAHSDSHPDVDGTVIVRAGDTLWSIAARHLPDDASLADIDASWRDWYAANRSTIGDDPNLILPGQELTAPRN